MRGRKNKAVVEHGMGTQEENSVYRVFKYSYSKQEYDRKIYNSHACYKTAAEGFTTNMNTIQRTATTFYKSSDILTPNENTTEGSATTMAATRTTAEITTTNKSTLKRTVTTSLSSQREIIISIMFSNGTLPTTFGLSLNFGTVTILPLLQKFAFNLYMVMRLICSAMSLTGVFLKTPFVREMKQLVKWGNEKAPQTETYSMSV